MLSSDKERRTFPLDIAQLCKNTDLQGFPQSSNVTILKCCHTQPSHHHPHLFIGLMAPMLCFSLSLGLVLIQSNNFHIYITHSVVLPRHLPWVELCSLPNLHIKAVQAVFQNMTLFGKGVIADIIKMACQFGPQHSMTGVLIKKKGNLKRDRHA